MRPPLSSLSSSAKNLVRMTRWSSSLWDLKPSYTTSVDANQERPSPPVSITSSST
jgi:hypothetical protein